MPRIRKALSRWAIPLALLVASSLPATALAQSAPTSQFGPSPAGSAGPTTRSMTNVGSQDVVVMYYGGYYGGHPGIRYYGPNTATTVGAPQVAGIRVQPKVSAFDVAGFSPQWQAAHP